MSRPSLCRGTLKLNGEFECGWLLCPVGMDDDPPAAIERKPEAERGS